MFDYKHYVSILRWKKGERTALRELYPEEREHLSPVIEIPSDAVEKALDRMTVNAFASRIRIEILECWGTQPAFVDISQLITRIDPAQRSRFVEEFYAQAKRVGLVLVPVTTISSIYVPNTTGNGLCLRVSRQDLESNRLHSNVNAWLSNHKAVPAEVDVILDLGIVNSLDQSYLQTYSKIPLLDKWRTVTIAGGSFPKDLQGLSIGEHLLPRIEWHLWKEIVNVRPKRIPTFGDYATLHPSLQPFFPGMNVSASIRYTADNHWLVMRGEGLRNEGGPGYAQYPANAELLMEHQEFCGREFSFGDNYIYERPIKKNNPGIPMNWVTVGVNHHLTFVVRQIARLFDLPLPRRHYRPDETQLPLLHAGAKLAMQRQPRFLGPAKKR